MIKKIAHLADIHFQNDLDRLLEQYEVAQRALSQVKSDKPDLIVVAGDLFHNYVKPFNEINVLASHFLTELSNIADVVIIDGNHDLMKINLNRMSSIDALVRMLNNPRIHYFNETNFFEIENIVFAVWYHPDRKSPWLNEITRDPNKIYIDLFHDPITGCLLQNGQTYHETNSVSLNDFKGDIVMAGDIHLQQSYKKNGKEFFAYPSSLYAGNFGEGDDQFHGYLLWDLDTLTFEKREVVSEYRRFNVYISEGYDYDNIDISLVKPAKNNYIKIHWMDDASTFTTENKNRIKKYLNENYSVSKIIFDRSKIINKNLLINGLKDEFDINNTEDNKQAFKEFLFEKGYDQDFVDEILELDNLIDGMVEKDTEGLNVEWKIKSWSLDNFKSHGDETTIDLENMNGIIQIYGENQAGKCVHPTTKIKIRFDQEKIKKVLGYLPEFLK